MKNLQNLKLQAYFFKKIEKMIDCNNRHDNYIKILFNEGMPITLKQRRYILKRLINHFKNIKKFYLINEYYVNNYYAMYIHYVDIKQNLQNINYYKNQVRYNKIDNNTLSWYDNYTKLNQNLNMSHFIELDINNVKLINFINKIR